MRGQVTLAVGTTVHISNALPATNDQRGFEALTYTPIKGVRDAGEIDEKHNTITRSPLALNYSYQERVGVVLPTLSWDVIRLKSNAGQQMLKKAFSGPVHAFQIIHSDGEELFFTAAVSARRRIIVDSSTILAWRYELDLQSEVVEVG